MYKLIEYKPYSEALNKYNKHLEGFKSDIDIKSLEEEVQQSKRAVLDVEAEVMLSEGKVSEKKIIPLKRAYEEATDKLNKAQAKAQYDKEVHETGVRILKQRMEEEKAKAEKVMSEQALKDHKKIILEIVNTARKLADLCQQEEQISTAARNNGIDRELFRFVKAGIDPGLESNSYSNLRGLINNIKKANYDL